MADLKIAATPDFKIEKGLAPPPQQFKHLKYPFAQMEIGDSFAVPVELYAKIASSASYASARHHKKFSVRKDGNAYRCWRTA